MGARFLKILGVLTLFFNLQALGQQKHDGHEGWPENTLRVLEGQDAITKADCLLFVTEVGYTGPEQSAEQFYAVVETSYAHGSDHATPFTVKAIENKPGVLAGSGSNRQDQIAIFLDPQDLDLRNIKSFNIKWLHGNHFHNNRCINMTVHEH